MARRQKRAGSKRTQKWLKHIRKGACCCWYCEGTTKPLTSRARSTREAAALKDAADPVPLRPSSEGGGRPRVCPECGRDRLVWENGMACGHGWHIARPDVIAVLDDSEPVEKGRGDD